MELGERLLAVMVHGVRMVIAADRLRVAMAPGVGRAFEEVLHPDFSHYLFI